MRDGRSAAKDVEKRLQLIHDQKDQFQRVDSRMEPPMLGQAHHAARAMKHEMEEGYGTESTRVYAYVRFAVAGPTSKAALERAQGLIKHYEAERIDLKFMRNVEGAYREFVPGEDISTTAHLRHMPVVTYAAGLPNVSSRLGDREGHLIGTTVGAGGHPFIWDMHQGMERFSRSGLTPLVSGLGGGKSTLMGLFAALETLSNVSTTVFDPSGPLARITKWEPIAHVSKSLNLLDAAEGTLSPFGVVIDRRSSPSRQTMRCGRSSAVCRREGSAGSTSSRNGATRNRWRVWSGPRWRSMRCAASFPRASCPGR